MAPGNGGGCGSNFHRGGVRAHRAAVAAAASPAAACGLRLTRGMAPRAAAGLEQAAQAVRKEHADWSNAKIAEELCRQGFKTNRESVRKLLAAGAGAGAGAAAAGPAEGDKAAGAAGTAAAAKPTPPPVEALAAKRRRVVGKATEGGEQLAEALQSIDKFRLGSPPANVAHAPPEKAVQSIDKFRLGSPTANVAHAPPEKAPLATALPAVAPPSPVTAGDAAAEQTTPPARAATAATAAAAPGLVVSPPSGQKQPPPRDGGGGFLQRLDSLNLLAFTGQRRAASSALSFEVDQR